MIVEMYYRKRKLLCNPVAVTLLAIFKEALQDDVQ